MGQRSSGGFHIIVDGIYERDNKLEVVVKNSLPGKNCLVTTALTEPVDIVRLQKSDLSIVFRELMSPGTAAPEPHYDKRRNVMCQFHSHVSPLSGENAWLQTGTSAFDLSHLNITTIGFPA